MRARELMLTLMIGGALLGAAQAVRAQEEVPLDPNTRQAVMGTIGNDALQLGFMSHGDPVRGADLDIGLLITENRQFLATGALMFGSDITALPGLSLRFGPKAYLGWLEGVGKTQIAAIAGGVSGRYDILPEEGVAVVLQAFFAPNVLSFGAANNVYDFVAGAEYRVDSRFTVLAGYRWLKITLSNQPDNKLLNEVYAGVRWRFR